MFRIVTQVEQELSKAFLWLITVFLLTSCGGGGANYVQPQPPPIVTSTPKWGTETKLLVGDSLSNPIIKFSPSGKCYVAWTCKNNNIWISTLNSNNEWESDSINNRAGLCSLVAMVFDENQRPVLVWRNYGFADVLLRSCVRNPTGWGPVQDIDRSISGTYSIDASAGNHDSQHATLVYHIQGLDSANSQPYPYFARQLDSNGNWGAPIRFLSDFLAENSLYPVYPPMESMSFKPNGTSIYFAPSGDIHFFWSQYDSGSIGSQWYARWNPLMRAAQVIPVDKGSDHGGNLMLAPSSSGNMFLLWSSDDRFIDYQYSVRFCSYSIATGFSTTTQLEKYNQFGPVIRNQVYLHSNEKLTAVWATTESSSTIKGQSKLWLKTTFDSSNWSPNLLLFQTIQPETNIGFIDNITISNKKGGGEWVAWRVGSAGNDDQLWISSSGNQSGWADPTQVPAIGIISEGPFLVSHPNGVTVLGWVQQDHSSEDSYLHIMVNK